ncbi:MAG: hypothetical protein E6689_02660 [Corynebacterium striatum]|uniref:hypothetical protein n=1 Tax=Corynebacterium sp. c25Ua_89 TaxID=3032356 RepID=UPI0028FFD64C|nr:hypothetical protein [Corynebacterium striatum]
MNSRLADSPSRPSRLRGALLCLLVVLPLVVGAIVAGVTGWDASRAWSSEGTGAPTEGQSDAASLSEAARAASQAQAQAGFLKSGTQQLSTGTGKLKDGAGELGGGVDKLSAGSQELYDGLIQLQSGTNQLGNGATEVANGVGNAVDQITGLTVVQGQLLAAIDGTLKDLEGNNSPEARNIKSQLGDLRNQVNNFQIDQNLTNQLKRLKDGSRELSNQLAVNGYAYHDGVYKAADGAKRLNDGTKELNSKVDEALGGIDKLDKGAKRVDGMAKQNQTKVQDVQRALPAAADGQGAEVKMLSPIVALLIAAMVSLGGTALGAYVVRSRKPWLSLLAGVVVLTAAAEIVFMILATGVDGMAAGLAAAMAAATALGSAGLTAVVLHYFPKLGSGVVIVLGLLQLAVVGWFWKQATAATAVAGVWKTVMGLLPMHWSTVGFTVAGNSGPLSLAWIGLGILAAVGIFSIGIMKRGFSAIYKD